MIAGQLIRNPAGQRQAAVPDRIRCQLGVVEATQSQTDHQDHRRGQLQREIRQGLLVVQRCQPAAGAFDQCELSLQRGRAHRIRERIHVNRYARGPRGQVWRSRQRQAHGIDVFVGQRQRARGLQPERVVVAPALRRAYRAGRDRLQAETADPGLVFGFCWSSWTHSRRC